MKTESLFTYVCVAIDAPLSVRRQVRWLLLGQMNQRCLTRNENIFLTKKNDKKKSLEEERKEDKMYLNVNFSISVW